MTTPYTTGTISLTNGSAVITGIGTAWEIALIKGGVVYAKAAGNALPIASVDSDTQITAAVEWAGETGTYSYALVRDTTYDAQIAQNAEALARLLAGLEAGTLWKYDMSGDTPGRDIYDGKPKGFSYLDVSVVPAQLWVKASNTEGDWAGPHSYGQGAEGEPGPAPSLTFSPVETGEPGTPANLVVTGGGPYNLAFTIPAGLTGFRWRGAYDAGASYLERDGVRDNGSTWLALQDTIGNAPPVLPATSNAFWELVAAKGTDGTGTGDVVGPPSSIDGHMALFDGTAGDHLKDGGAPFSGSYADLSGKPTLGGAAALNVGTTSGTVAAGDDGRIAGAVQTSRSIATQYSLQGGGNLSANRTISLVGDAASPGSNKVYGTDGSGARGWKDDPAGGGIGVGQTWQNVAGSRVIGTSYQNTSGRPIQVNVTILPGSSATQPTLQVSQDNLTWIGVDRGQDGTDFAHGSAVVPSGHYYRVNVGALIAIWAELR